MVKEPTVVEEPTVFKEQPIEKEVNPLEIWNTIIKAAEDEVSLSKDKLVTQDTTQTNYVQNEEQNESGMWEKLSKVISRDEYNQKIIQEMTEKVKSGQLPFYQVPAEFQQEIRKGLGQWEPR